MALLPINLPLYAPVLDDDGLHISRVWKKYFEDAANQIASGAVTGPGTLNNLTMFTGTGTIGDAPGFTYDPTGLGSFALSKSLKVSQSINSYGGSNAVNLYGVGSPGSPNFEGLSLSHNGTNAIIAVGTNGSGTYRDLSFYNGGTERAKISPSGVVTVDDLSSANITLVAATTTGALENAPGIIYNPADGGIYTFANFIQFLNSILGLDAQFTSLAGTGNRIVTSNPDGVVGNATNIDGSYSIYGNLGVGNATDGAEFAINGKSGFTPNYVFVTDDHANTLDIRASSGSDANVSLLNSGAGNMNLLVDGSITTNTLTSGRVTFSGANGILKDSANLTFDGTTIGIGKAPGTARLQVVATNDANTGGIILRGVDDGQSIASLYGLNNAGSRYGNFALASGASQKVFLTSRGDSSLLGGGLGLGKSALGNAMLLVLASNDASDGGITVRGSDDIADIARIYGLNVAGTRYGNFELQNGAASKVLLTSRGASYLNGGTVTIGDLSGTNSRLVQVDTNGLLSATLLSTISQTLWTKTASTALANSTTETTLLDTGVGSKTLAAAFLTVGKSISFEIVGYYSTTLTPTIQFKFKLGSTTILDSGAITTANSVSNQQVRFRGVLTCRSTGGSGAVFAQGEVIIAGLSTPLVTVTNTAATTVDTTGTLAMDITAQWGSLSLSDSITATNATIESKG